MRMNEETEFRPKPLVKIGHLPVLVHVMKTYAHWGYKDFILCLGYRGEMIKDYFLNFDEHNNDFTLKMGAGPKRISYVNKKKIINDWQITFADTGLGTNTGGRLARVKNLLAGEEDFFLTYADGVADINLPDVYRYHKSKKTIGTLCGVDYVNPFGIIEPKAGLVADFQEKPRSAGHINGGFYVFNKAIFKYVVPDENCVLEKGPLQALSKKGQLGIYAHRGFWHCMDHMKHVEELNAMYHSGHRPWMMWET